MRNLPPKNNKFITRKIPLELFISLLEEIYVTTNSEYIDLRSEIDVEKEQDKIFAIIKDEYIKKNESPKPIEEFKAPEVPVDLFKEVDFNLKDILNNI